MLYYLLISCTSYQGFCSISLLWMGYSTIASSWHMCFYQYFCESYNYVYCDIFCVLYTIYSYVVIYFGKCVMYFSSLIVPLLPYSLTCIHNSVSTPPCLDFPLIFCMHWNTYIHSYFLNISYIYFSFKYFFCRLLLGQIFDFHIKNSKTCNNIIVILYLGGYPAYHASYLVTHGSNAWH